MRSDRRAAPSEAGFTLIEVLAAMIILAVGLLSLQALGIGAARSVAMADRKSEQATLASDSLESALRQLRSGALPSQFCLEGLPRVGKLSRTVDLSQSNLVRVTVEAIPDPESSTGARTPFVVSSSVFTTLTGTPDASPCL